MDLGANEWTTFWRVTFPLIFPGIMAAAAAGLQPVDRRLRHHQLRLRHDQHLPHLDLRASSKNALPSQVNVIGSIIFLVSVGSSE